MTQAIKLSADLREGTPNALRSAGMIPAVLYGHGIKNELIKVDAKKFQAAFQKAGYTTLVELMVGDKMHNVLIRETQAHALKGHVTHIDFYQVRMDEKVKADVQLDFVGETGVVNDQGGIMIRNIDTVEVEALPKDLPHDIKVDISKLVDFDTVIHISDLEVPAGVTILSDPESVVVSIQRPRTEEELASLSEEAIEDVESVEGVKDKEPVAEEGAEDAKKEEPKE